MEIRKHIDTLIIHGSVLTMQASDSIIYDGAVAVDQGRIVAVGKTTELTQQYQAKKVIDAKYQWVMPGFVNGHTHMGMTLLRSSADHARSVRQWLKYYIFQFERDLLSYDFVYWSTMLACYEMIQSGITTVSDMYFMQDVAAEVVEIAGIRAILGETIFKRSDIARAEQVRQRMRMYKNSTFSIAPHSVYSCTEGTLRASAHYAQEHDIPVQIHVAEHISEVKKLKSVRGYSPIEYLDKLGLLNHQLLIAHGIHVSPADIKKIAHARASVVYCPTSNMKLGSGIAPVLAYHKAGIAVALGTDGAASNNNLNMISEMKIGTLLQQVFPTPQGNIMAYDLMHAATLGGARALNLSNEIGSLEPGKSADIIIIKNDDLSQLPWHHAYDQIVYATASDAVQTVMAQGKLLMHDRQMLTLSAYQQDLYAAVVKFQREILVLHKNLLLNTHGRSR